VLVFVTAFIVQWGTGGILRAREDTTTHQYDPTGYQVAFLVVAVLQLTALAWFLRKWLMRADSVDAGKPLPETDRIHGLQTARMATRERRTGQEGIIAGLIARGALSDGVTSPDRTRNP